MNTAVTVAKVDVPSLAMSEQELMSVLRNSLYPGAKDESIKLVISYCRASGLDPMQKPVHIVPMNVKDAQTGKYDWRDVVMPGIGLYRTQAARTLEYAGVGEPEFGPDTEFTAGEFTLTIPQWCRVTVRRRLPDGQIGEYTAKELWRENYATAGKDTVVPNAMWKKRPYAQLAKCAEAQALRKAFPEAGAQPTAEEMTGKTLDEDEIVNGRAVQPKLDMPRTASAAAAPAPAVDLAQVDNAPISEGEKKWLANKIAAMTMTKDELMERSTVNPDKEPLSRGEFLLLKAVLVKG